MNADRPKQYLALHGKSVLAHTLERLAAHSRIAGVAVALAADDGYWRDADVAEFKDKLFPCLGGAERCHSVLACLQRLAQLADENDWVLVHDAARPCLRTDDIDILLTSLAAHPVGGLLAVPVRDTIKRAGNSQEVLETVPREHLWQAMTPQMFRLGALRAALESALAAGKIVTDEAQAMELQGYQPKLIEGHADNIKITRPEDLKLAAIYFSQ
jgi:2-C-methyl-D-erythritol 4-phosphate cytidylyltransferase